ncbi:hypothetical protein [Seleniivibrio sp.]|uniref:hypothetical protein n=1 Tax=Seleniivibrio sp. TaxID=2898801 RepID=UPI0025EB64B5|nr:hypothetical protein [Seleniivibrio sp.]MCD8553239.1 hypothetical protein [Seleniivibrio sp.]
MDINTKITGMDVLINNACSGLGDVAGSLKVNGYVCFETSEKTLTPTDVISNITRLI